MAVRGSKPGERRGGRKKGVPNKTTQLLKDAILEAAEKAGDAATPAGQKKAGLIGYLKQQAKDNPGPFMSLRGKVLPLQIANDGDETFKVTMIERVIVKAPDQDG